MSTKINIESLHNFVSQSLTAYGMQENYAEMVAQVYTSATLRGVGHHDIYDFKGRLNNIEANKININPEFKQLHAFGAMESWDADNTLGELACSFGIRKAMELADVHGIGFCALQNTNHFLASAPYVSYAAEKGYIAIVLAKSAVNMSMPNSEKSCMSALPMGFAYPTNQDYPVMLDFCTAYASMGQLHERKSNNKEVSPWWGSDVNGETTTSATDMIKGARYPIGLHKGFGLSMLGEVLTGVMSSGTIMDQGCNENNHKSVTSHTAIAIKADAFFSIEEFKEKSTYISDRAKELGGNSLHIPGEGSAKSQSVILEQGYIELKDDLIKDLNEFAVKLNINTL
ncbi:MAG: Ldh family oxidoreductase [Clostridia bacterium]